MSDLQLLSSKFAQLVNQGSFLEITKASQNLEALSTFRFQGKTVKTLTPVQSGEDLFIFKNDADGSLYAIAGKKEPVGVLSERRILSRHTHPIKKRGARVSKFVGDYAILYSHDQEQVVDFWIATTEYEVKVYSLKKERVPPDPIPQFDPGYYLVVWADNMYPTANSEAFEEVIKVGFESVYQQDIKLPGSSNLDLLFRNNGGFTIPKPSGWSGKPNFTGRYIIPLITTFYSMWTGSPLEHTFEGTGGSRRAVYDIPEDAVFRTSIRFIFSGEGIRPGDGENVSIWEYTDVSGVTPNEFDLFKTWMPPESITSKGFVREELRRANNHTPYGGIYAPRHDLGRPLDSSTFFLTFAMIPWNQEPGPAYPGSNRFSISRGPNGDNVNTIFGEGGFFPDPNPPIIYDGRSSFTPSPTAVQPSTFRLGTYEAYLSAKGPSPVFFIKTDDERERLGGVANTENPNFKTYAYKKILPTESVKDLKRASIDNHSPGSDPDTDYTKAIILGFEEWKAYLHALNRNFDQLRSPQVFTNVFGQQSRSFARPFVGKNIPLARDLLEQGRYFDNKFYISIPTGSIETFLKDPTSEGVGTFGGSLVTYTSPRSPNGGYYNYDESLIDLGQGGSFEIKVTKPQNLTRLLTSSEDDVVIIDIVPLVSNKLEKLAAKLQS